jgi:hypothetical protein
MQCQVAVKILMGANAYHLGVFDQAFENRHGHGPFGGLQGMSIVPHEEHDCDANLGHAPNSTKYVSKNGLNRRDGRTLTSSSLLQDEKLHNVTQAWEDQDTEKGCFLRSDPTNVNITYIFSTSRIYVPGLRSLVDRRRRPCSPRSLVNP